MEAPTFSRLLSGKRRSTRRQRSRGSESEDPHSLQHQDSLHAQVSITADPTSPKRMLSKEALKKKQLEWDSDLKEVGHHTHTHTLSHTHTHTHTIVYVISICKRVCVCVCVCV